VHQKPGNGRQTIGSIATEASVLMKSQLLFPESFITASGGSPSNPQLCWGLLAEAYSLACAVAVPAVFQTRITPSSPADSRRRPPAEKVTAGSGPEWPRKTRGPRPLRKSHSFTCPSSPAEASRRSPCANASEVIRPWCARKERWGREEEVDHSRTAPV